MIPHLERKHEDFIEVSVLEDTIGSKGHVGFPSGQCDPEGRWSRKLCDSQKSSLHPWNTASQEPFSCGKPDWRPCWSFVSVLMTQPCARCLPHTCLQLSHLFKKQHNNHPHSPLPLAPLWGSATQQQAKTKYTEEPLQSETLGERTTGTDL